MQRLNKHFEALGQSPIQPSEVFFLDDKKVNVEGARKAGLRAKKFDSRKDTPKRLKKLLKDNGIDL